MKKSKSTEVKVYSNYVFFKNKVLPTGDGNNNGDQDDVISNASRTYISEEGSAGREISFAFKATSDAYFGKHLVTESDNDSTSQSISMNENMNVSRHQYASYSSLSSRDFCFECKKLSSALSYSNRSISSIDNITRHVLDLYNDSFESQDSADRAELKLFYIRGFMYNSMAQSVNTY
uniref:Ovule protein n=1 Tax=Rhabditophanes sp. KR3021 TaxID=114890 RepID=A0AC35TNI5_9BILA